MDSENPNLSMQKELCIYREEQVLESGWWLDCENEKVGRYYNFSKRHIIEKSAFLQNKYFTFNNVLDAHSNAAS